MIVCQYEALLVIYHSLIDEVSKYRIDVNSVYWTMVWLIVFYHFYQVIFGFNVPYGSLNTWSWSNDRESVSAALRDYKTPYAFWRSSCRFCFWCGACFRVSHHCCSILCIHSNESLQLPKPSSIPVLSRCVCANARNAHYHNWWKHSRE